MTRKTLSPEKQQQRTEARRQKLETMRDTLNSQVMAFEQDPQQWAAFVAFAAQFHRYSFKNLVLIYAQRDTASFVASFKFWKDRGTPVRKGEKAISIYAPGTVTVKDEDGEPILDDQGKPQKKTVFFPVPVFDVAQTEAAEEAEDLSPARKLTGEDTSGIGEAIRAYLNGLGWNITESEAIAPANGMTEHQTMMVTLRPGLSEAQTAKTLIHEAAHAILHGEAGAAERINHRGRLETEAESVAYLVAAALDLDTSGYTIPYVAGWSGKDAEVIEQAGAAVITGAHTILDAIAPEQDEEETAEAA